MKSTFKRLSFIIAILVIGLVLLVTSKKEVPLEVANVEKLVTTLQRVDASKYAATEFEKFQLAHQEAKSRLENENKKLVWFRQYDPIATDFGTLLREGETLREKVLQEKKNRADNLFSDYQRLTSSTVILNQMTQKMNEGRLARKDLMRAQLQLHEMIRFHTKGNYTAAQQSMVQVKYYLQQSLKAMNKILFRYKNPSQIDQWIKWISETTSESKRTGGAAIIVNKIDRQLILYKSGHPIKTYAVGLGRNGLNSKLHAGDNATPEGRYRVLKKNPFSRYYKALLLDYPNKEDRHQFMLARQKGLIPKQVGIGNLIEIHGGGIVFMTRGCVAMENNDMDEIFQAVTNGTPVTIVGSIGYPQEILSAIAEI